MTYICTDLILKDKTPFSSGVVESEYEVAIVEYNLHLKDAYHILISAVDYNNSKVGAGACLS